MLENNRNQLISIFIVAVVFFILVLLFVFLSDPVKLSSAMIALFYLCLSGLLLSGLSLVLFSLRSRNPNNIHANQMAISVRQAFWLTLLVVGSLMLSAHQLLFWWLEIIFIITLIMLEGFFLSSKV